MPVDLFGLPADADAVRAVAEAHGLPVVEDACQAWGATYNGRRAGSLGDMAVFSFFPTKNLGGYGDGGLVTAHDDVLVQRARELRFHGSKDKKTFTDIGFNSRLDEVQAAILRIELEVIDAVERAARPGGGVVRPVPAGGGAAPGRARRPHARLPPLRDPAPAARRHRRRLQGAPGGLRRVLHHAAAAAAGVRRPTATSSATSPPPTRRPQQNLAIPMHPNLTEEQVQEVAAAVAAGLA